MVFAPSSLILTNYHLPLSEALGFNSVSAFFAFNLLVIKKTIHQQVISFANPSVLKGLIEKQRPSYLWYVYCLGEVENYTTLL